MKEKSVVFVTNGVLINLCATGRISEILTVQPFQCAIINTILTKPPTLWDFSSDGPIFCQEMVSNLVTEGVLHAYSLQREQYIHTHVLLGRYLREELADLFTLANAHQAAVALDDRVIKKRVTPLLPNLSIYSTLALLHTWHTITRLPSSEVQLVLRLVAQRAHFLPPSDDPFRPWWNQFATNKEISNTYEH
jgi:hypothetical protein